MKDSFRRSITKGTSRSRSFPWFRQSLRRCQSWDLTMQVP